MERGGWPPASPELLCQAESFLGPREIQITKRGPKGDPGQKGDPPALALLCQTE